MKFIAAVSFAAILSGCAAIQDAKDEQRIERYSRTCEKLGYVRDTAQFQDC
jgi:hypothetical protein